jgi:UDP-3-O-[3-hydroxymyristoyl] glucosamine N-acyltransferase
VTPTACAPGGAGGEHSLGVSLAAPVTVSELVARFGVDASRSDASLVIERVLTPEQAASGAAQRGLVLLTAAAKRGLLDSASSLVLTTPELAPRCRARGILTHSHPLWVVAELMREPELAAPRVTELLPAGPTASGAFIEAGARVEVGVELGAATWVAAGAVVRAGARIGASSRIGEYAVIHGAVRLGARVVVGAHAVIGRPGFGWTQSPDGRTVRVPQRGGVIVEDDVEIGPLATVDAGALGPTHVGTGTKLDAHVHVGHNAKLGPHTFVAAQAGFAGSVEVGARVRVGGQAGIADHVRVGDGAAVAAQSGVIRDVRPGERVAGFPALPAARWFRAFARLLRA